MSLLNLNKLLARAAENWLAKVLSIALAIILFVFHRMSSLENRFFSVPLTVEVNPTLVPANSYTRIVRVSLRGDATSIYPILEDDIEAYIDLKKYDSPGLYRAPVQIRKLGTALGVEPLEISVDPIEMSLELDQKMSKYIHVSANLRGSVQAGYDLISYTLTPSQVVVEGPLTLLENITGLSTDYIDLGERSEDFFLTVNILNLDPRLVIRGNGETEFHGLIRQTVPVRNFDGLPITVRNLAEGLAGETELKIGTVRLEGPQNQLDQFEPPPDFLYLDGSEITGPGTYTLPVQADLPGGFTLLRQEPQEAVIQVSARSSAGEGAP
jgi:YbbR domain-containing protein